MKITLNREGAGNYTKTSYPVRYGRYTEIEYNSFRLQFNLNNEVKYIAGTGPDWPHPAEWLKRTQGNDWVYYSTGDYYSGVFDLFGEYYFPYPAYPTNCLFKENPFSRKNVIEALQKVEELAALARGKRLLPYAQENDSAKDLQAAIGNNSSELLWKRAGQLHRILKARISVLPPDCRHVDYDIIPVMVTDGCLYNCSFCEIKSGMDLACRTREDIMVQLAGLREFFGPDLVNYNSIYLGQHDTLAAEPEDIIFAAQAAYEILHIERSCMNGPKQFLFGSCESFLRMDKYFWDDLNNLPYYSYINIGLESFDGNTLEFLEKPVSASVVADAFDRMLEINKNYEQIEVTANFLLGGKLPDSHYTSLTTFLGESIGRHQAKGCIYLSPLKGSRDTRDLLARFREIKHRSRMDTFLYLIQRL